MDETNQNIKERHETLAYQAFKKGEFEVGKKIFHLPKDKLLLILKETNNLVIENHLRQYAVIKLDQSFQAIKHEDIINRFKGKIMSIYIKFLLIRPLLENKSRVFFIDYNSIVKP